MTNGCKFNGYPFEWPQGFTYTAETTGAGALALNQSVTTQMVMQQLTVHWDAIPTTSEDFTLWIDSVSGTKFDTILRSVDPSTGAENIKDFTCVVPWIWLPGDAIRIDYPNTDAQNIGAKILLQQVIGR